MKNLYVILVVVLALLTVGNVAAADSGGGAPRVTTLSGAEEVPAADPDGTGFASITLNVGQQRVCWELSVSDIAPATAAHIHAAPVGVNGPVIVPLSPPTTGTSSGCLENVNPMLIQAIIDHPEQYYVNVHNAEFPGGAVRGQLSNRGQSK
ncbi:MAG: CHRD domain-containing protein [Anaerolineales bacterium]